LIDFYAQIDLFVLHETVRSNDNSNENSSLFEIMQQSIRLAAELGFGHVEQPDPIQS
jgi:hypothetical protein